MTALIHELLTGEEYSITQGEKVAATRTDASTSAAPSIESSATQDTKTPKASKTSKKSPPSIDGISVIALLFAAYLRLALVLTSLPGVDFTISLLPIGVVSDLAQKPKFASMFDVVYFSNSMVHHFKPEITPAFKDTTRVLVESAKFIIELKKDQVELFAEKVVILQ